MKLSSNASPATKGTGKVSGVVLNSSYELSDRPEIWKRHIYSRFCACPYKSRRTCAIIRCDGLTSWKPVKNYLAGIVPHCNSLLNSQLGGTYTRIHTAARHVKEYGALVFLPEVQDMAVRRQTGYRQPRCHQSVASTSPHRWEHSPRKAKCPNAWVWIYLIYMHYLVSTSL
ncbi:hypothetical protein OE88DRAFT_278812 [Heliocybe sulcata]|uniref:Uncharacterized protein n=1 Tax=Heliocybe sulcata TaxID=5364 RepID=A0A5C3MYR2_9AGAM|nr:hypothetical protein OE88DRAFT_278812 [Heliocybe sulcata]